MATLEEYRNERLEKLAKLRELGYEPYPSKSLRDTKISKVNDDFEEQEGKQVTVAGRIMAMRGHGKLRFFDLMDGSGKLQLLVRANAIIGDVAEGRLEFDHLSLLGRGDFIEAYGTVTKTKTGQVSIEADSIRLLTKAIRPIPDDWTGLKDKETRLRRRYLDTVLNDDVRERFVRRAKFWQATRDFLNNEEFIEINTPVLEHSTGGADAKPFETHMDALNENFYLRISHELPLKRLIGGGYDKVYDIGPRFRNENYSDEHLPEHIAFESYGAYQDYEDGMELYERQMKEVAEKTWGTLKFKDINGFDIDLNQDWPRIKYADIMKEKFDVDVFNPDDKQLKKILSENKVSLDDDANTARLLDNVWKIIRRESAGPFWMIHEPVSISPLAKQDPQDSRVTQRFHPVIAGTEMGNGYSELNDPVDQLNRFVEQQNMREAGDDEAQMLDIDFVEMLEYGMPPACGWSYSERFFWVFEGVSAREGVPFPALRQEVSETTRKTYPELYSSEGILAKSGERKQDMSKRIVAVVDKTLENWQVANAVAHMAAYHGNKMDEKVFQSGKFFVTKGDETLPRNSQHPIMIKKAEQRDLHKIIPKVKQANLKYHVFIKEMIETSIDKEIVDKVKDTELKDLIIYGIAVFGDNDEVNKLTKHFQLWN